MKAVSKISRVRSKVMILAWRFIRVNKLSRSEALKKAWANVKLVGELRRGVTGFKFVKKNGELREARGTLMSAQLPPVHGVKTTDDSCQIYFDVDKNAWRCFKKADLVLAA